MAFDYRSADPPLPPHGAYLDPPDQPAPTASYSAPLPRRSSRSSSADGSQSSQQGQPVYEAVNNAFDKSNAASQLDRDLVAQITEEVRKQVLDTLKSSGQLSSPSRPRERKPSLPELSAAAPPYPKRVYTPPSPTRHDSIHSTDSSSSPKPPAQDPYFKSDAKDREGPAPRFSGTHATSSITPDHGSQYGAASQYSNTSANAQHPPRPPVQRHFTDVEETAIEKTWRPLFDADGLPTPRLSQFLRGLALHLMQDYEPKGTLVVTPAKMRKFYEETRVQDEIYPWSTIFGTLSNSAISKMYRDLRCLHHLVQEKPDEVPNVPSLTPVGFDTWMTLMIQGHPEIEFARLAKAVMHMPISNSDDIKERFPKELPRRLFPKFENLPARQRCAAAICSNGKITIRTPTFPPPPRTQPPTQPPPASYPSYPTDNREASVAPDSDNEPVAIPIERERKPYVAREGTGKLYEHFAPNNHANNPTPMVGLTSESAPPDAGGPSRAPRNSYPNVSSAASCANGLYRTSSHSEYPPSTSQTRNYRTGFHYKSSRRRSPSSSTSRTDGYGTRSEPGNVGDIPASYYTSNIYSDPGEDDNGVPRSASRAQFEMNGQRSSYTAGSQARHNSLYDQSDHYRRTSAYNGYPPPPPRYTS